MRALVRDISKAVSQHHLTPQPCCIEMVPRRGIGKVIVSVISLSPLVSPCLDQHGSGGCTYLAV